MNKEKKKLNPIYFLSEHLNRTFRSSEWLKISEKECENNSKKYIYLRNIINKRHEILILEIIKPNIEDVDLKTTQNDYDTIEEEKNKRNIKKQKTYISKIVIKENVINENKELLEYYLLIKNKTRSEKREELFEKYGVSIYTEKMFSKNKSKENNYDASLFHSIEIKKITSTDPFKSSNTYVELKNAKDIPTSSSFGGIQNVRDIYNIKKKESQFESILNTLKNIVEKIKESNTTNIEDSCDDYKFWFARNGKEKDFAYIKEETEIESYKDKDSSNEHFLLSTTNGSLIDGQNSIDTLYHIDNLLNFLNKRKESTKFSENIEFKESDPTKIIKFLKTQKIEIEKEFEQTYTSFLKIKESDIVFIFTNIEIFVILLKKTLIKVNFTEVLDNEIAASVADTKNSSIKVEEQDLDISKRILEAVLISNFAYKTSSVTNKKFEDLLIDVYYPKKKSSFYEKSILSLNFTQLACAYMNYSSIKEKAAERKQNEDEYIDLFTQDFSKYRFFYKNKESENELNVFFENFIEKKETGKELRERKEKEELLWEEIINSSYISNNELFKKEQRILREELAEEKAINLKQDIENIKIENKEELNLILSLIKNATKGKELFETKILMEKGQKIKENLDEYIMAIILIKLFKCKEEIKTSDITIIKMESEIESFYNRLEKVKNVFATDLTGIFNKSKKRDFTAKVDNYKKNLNQNDLIKYLLFENENYIVENSDLNDDRFYSNSMLDKIIIDLKNLSESPHYSNLKIGLKDSSISFDNFQILITKVFEKDKDKKIFKEKPSKKDIKELFNKLRGI